MRSTSMVIAIMLGTNFAHAEVVTYTVTGELQDVGNNQRPYPQDWFDLDGAQFVYTFKVDTESLPISDISYNTYNIANYGLPVIATMTIANRPNNQADVNSSVSPFYAQNKMSYTLNAYVDSGYSDRFGLSPAYVDGIADLRTGEMMHGFSGPLFFEGNGSAALPSSWSPEDISLVTGGGWVGGYAGLSYFYDVTITSFTVSTALSPAQLWLIQRPGNHARLGADEMR